MKIKTSELSGVALDWAAAKAIDWIEPIYGIGAIRYIQEDQYLAMTEPDPDEPDERTDSAHFVYEHTWSPSRIWSQGGPLIERFSVTLGKRTDCPPGPRQWDAFIDTKFCPSATYVNFGSSPLIAACRAIVSAKLGDEVDVPDELA